MHSTPRFIIGTAIAFLLVLNAGLYLLGDRPLRTEGQALELPQTLRARINGPIEWRGEPRKLLYSEEAVLAPAKLTARIYKPTDSFSAGDRWQWVWVDTLQSQSTGSMHNFFDSMIASGGKPRVLGTHRIKTARGELETSLVSTQSINGRLYYMLLWYQSRTGSASNRWEWYGHILNDRMQQRQSAWTLVKVATPVRQPEIPALQSSELLRLEAFSRAFYENAFSDREKP